MAPPRTWLRDLLLVGVSLTLIVLGLLLGITVGKMMWTSMSETPPKWGMRMVPPYQASGMDPGDLSTVVLTGSYSCGNRNLQCEDSTLTVALTGVQKVTKTNFGPIKAHFVDVGEEGVPNAWTARADLEGQNYRHVEIDAACVSGGQVTWHATLVTRGTSIPVSGSATCP